MEMPHFHGENWVKFRVWCIMVHQQGFVLVYMARANMLMLGQARDPQRV